MRSDAVVIFVADETDIFVAEIHQMPHDFFSDAVHVGDDLIHAWHQQEGEAAVPADWQTAELALHTWDLASTIGHPADRLDAEVAERALAFMRASLTTDNRGDAFGPECAAPADAGPYERLAAFAGRTL